MLSRTADHLFWMSRYTERAENTSRLLDVNYHTSLLPQSSHEAQAGWEGLLRISELMPAYTEKYGAEITPRNVLDFMVRDERNPSSIATCLRAARENARGAWHVDHRVLGNAKPDLAGALAHAQGQQLRARPEPVL